MGVLTQKIGEALELDQTERNRKLRGDLGKVQEQISHWGRSGTFKRSYAIQQAREEAAKIAERYQKELQREAEAARERVKDARSELQRTIERNAGAEEIRRQERAFLAKVQPDAEISARLARFAQAETRLEAVIQFNGWYDVTETFAEAERRGLPVAETFKQAWREAGDIDRVQFDQPATVNDLQRAKKIESLKPGTALIERPGTGEEMPVPIADLVDLSPLENLA